MHMLVAVREEPHPAPASWMFKGNLVLRDVIRAQLLEAGDVDRTLGHVFRGGRLNTGGKIWFCRT